MYRKVDITAMLIEPRKATPWRCEGIVADGTLTVLAGTAGDGKTWVAHGLAAGVARGEPFAGINCTQGRSLVIDGEMGAHMTVDRMRVAGIDDESGELVLVDAMGLSLALERDFEYLAYHIGKLGAKFVVLDSLRRLTPGVKENDSDSVTPILQNLARLARDTESAILLIHHKGKDGAPRGSSSIKDACDALYLLNRAPGNTDLRRLTCRTDDGKAPKYSRLPDDRYIILAPEQGGFVVGDAPTSDEQLKQNILNAAPAPNYAALAEQTDGVNHSASSRFKRLCKELEDEGHTLISSALGSRGEGATNELDF
jgi:hypothetical protein